MAYKQLLDALQRNTAHILTYVESESFDTLDELFDEREAIISSLYSASGWEDLHLEQLDNILNTSVIVQNKLEMAKQLVQKEAFSISKKNKAINHYKANEI
ncbi:hypothetical protein ACET6J_17505 [Aeromonas veronii]|uniref:hypothetical protein n=1 Tax=Aeromonas veronii TaxID=654 RepID=UPI0030040F82